MIVLALSWDQDYAMELMRATYMMASPSQMKVKLMLPALGSSYFITDASTR